MVGKTSIVAINEVSVAVIMCLYKTDCIAHFSQAVNSILRQDYNNLDLFICQDGPVSADLISYISYIEKKWGNINIIRNKDNKGFAFSLNRLIDTAIDSKDYEYIARMDGDDVARRSRIRRQVEHMENERDISVCGTWAREFGSVFAVDKKILPMLHDDLVDYSVARCPFIHPSVMFRASLFADQIRYPLIHLDEDMGLWYALILAGHRLSNVPEVLIDFRINDGTILRRKARGPFNDFKMRYIFLKKSKKMSAFNLVMICARLAFSLMPSLLMRFFYRHYR